MVQLSERNIVMIRFESDCVSCGFPCMYSACPYYRVKIYICDECDEEVETLYEYEGKELCESCLLEIVPKVV